MTQSACSSTSVSRGEGSREQACAQHRLPGTPIEDEPTFVHGFAGLLPSMGVHRVMVIDEYPVFRVGVRYALSQPNGPVILEVCTVVDAAQACAGLAPDAILLSATGGCLNQAIGKVREFAPNALILPIVDDNEAIDWPPVNHSGADTAIGRGITADELTSLLCSLALARYAGHEHSATAFQNYGLPQ